jgi:hypothetical protein
MTRDVPNSLDDARFVDGGRQQRVPGFDARRWSQPGMSDRLRPGLIFEMARSVGVDVPSAGRKRTIRCPLPDHSDESPSAFLSENNVFYCSCCTPGRGWPAKRFAEEFGLPWPPDRAVGLASRPSPELATAYPFTTEDAQATWTLALERARDDRFIERDQNVYAYLSRRGLMASWEDAAFGIVASSMSLPVAVREWPRDGYRVVVPLYDGNGRVVNVQSRAVTQISPKTRFPKGSKARGTMFADHRGLQVLKGVWTGPKQVLIGEGLTDHLALTMSSPIPVICSPGTGMAAAGIGPWASNFRVFLALDGDAAGAAATTAAADRVRRLGGHPLRVSWPDHKNDACEVLDDFGFDVLAEFLERITKGKSRGNQKAA